MTIVSKNQLEYSDDALKQMIIDRMNLDMEVEDLTDDIELADEGLGLDSIDLLEIASRLQKIFGISITQRNVEAFRTIGTLCEYCNRSLQENQA
ncbi:phosphopantetheine-binding protein [Cohnella lubricantis]|uniref:Acyl carrier protein n=1 Tax=Cohnella lubricantis TaxID=2163172 RepID=A0A841T948_9BACL|nr:phosphopantetheine-binding protein [Cohnella lubricantis]MBB6677462.1 acyl carrier protein [Cohnella lubricantis]MBP2116652.1 acyl carrier protein [Cohnella lubricantis]